jgi:hypothetical protein
VSPAPIDVPVTTSQAVTVTFVTDDGAPASALLVTSGLGSALPAGWTGPATFSCLSVSNGMVCQLVGLTYAPLAAASGSFQLGYSYTNDAGTAELGTVTVSYTAN